MFEELLARWELAPAGDPVETHSSALLPVIWQGRAAMLKVARSEEEARGGGLMEWWDGEGAARVFRHAGNALLMERATDRSLAEMSVEGRDDDATRIICGVANRLHQIPRTAPAGLAPLELWFRALEQAAVTGGILGQSANIAKGLLDAPHDIAPLHGDIHHGNILDFGERGWLAIDPKGLIGERAYDFANVFCNPDQAVAIQQFDRRLDLVSELAVLERDRLLRWVAAWAGLSAAFSIEDGEPPEDALEIAEIALARLP